MKASVPKFSNKKIEEKIYCLTCARKNVIGRRVNSKLRATVLKKGKDAVSLIQKAVCRKNEAKSIFRRLHFEVWFLKLSRQVLMV